MVKSLISYVNVCRLLQHKFSFVTDYESVKDHI